MYIFNKILFNPKKIYVTNSIFSSSHLSKLSRSLLQTFYVTVKIISYPIGRSLMIDIYQHLQGLTISLTFDISPFYKPV